MSEGQPRIEGEKVKENKIGIRTLGKVCLMSFLAACGYGAAKLELAVANFLETYKDDSKLTYIYKCIAKTIDSYDWPCCGETLWGDKERATLLHSMREKFSTTFWEYFDKALENPEILHIEPKSPRTEKEKDPEEHFQAVLIEVMREVVRQYEVPPGYEIEYRKFIQPQFILRRKNEA